jgi:hypothetical protein
MPLDFRDLDDTIRGGLPSSERDRLKDAWDNLRFSQAQFDEYPTRYPANNPYEREDTYRRTSPIMKRIVQVLTQNLYRNNPTRQLPTPEASAWLEKVYQRNHMGARWHRADQLRLIGDYAAFQFAGDTDPSCPVKVHLWGAESLVFWTDPDDALKVAAVFTIDRYNATRRGKLWTEDLVADYVTPQGSDHPGDGAVAWIRQGSPRPNPYKDELGRGVIPFSFVHAEQPTQEIPTPGPGNSLRQLNDAVNFGLDDLGDGVRYLAKPIGLAKGVSTTWNPPTVIRPGMFLNLPAVVTAGGVATDPDLVFRSPDLNFVNVVWNDLNLYCDHSLEMHGVPPSTVRMVMQARSGISIAYDQVPLLQWAETQRKPFACYEADAARTALRVGASHLAANGYASAAAPLTAALNDYRLSLIWGRLTSQLPGPELDRADTWLIGMGVKTKIDILMERQDLTEEQAVELLKTVSRRNRILTQLGIDPKPFAAPTPTPATTQEDDDNSDLGE